MDEPKGSSGNSRIEALRQREQALKAAIAVEQVKQQKRKEKDHARLVSIVGACLLADLETHPELREAVLQSLRRTATERDIAFLNTKGWRL